MEMDDMEEMDEMEVDWTRMFFPGMCPADVKGIEGLEASKLTGEWYLHRSSEFLYPEMTPTCHHCKMEIAADGSFKATEEATFMGKKFIADDITGLFTESTVRADFFDEKLSVKVQILDTDYDNYLIGYECFDNMKFALENDVEPVHVIKLAILTHNPDETKESIEKLENKVTEILPFWNKEDFAVIEQGEAAGCQYEKFDMADPKKEETSVIGEALGKVETGAKDAAKSVGETVKSIGSKISGDK